jgi:hypothetical protein
MALSRKPLLNLECFSDTLRMGRAWISYLMLPMHWPTTLIRTRNSGSCSSVCSEGMLYVPLPPSLSLQLICLIQVLLQPSYILEPDCSSHGNQIRDSGCKFYDGKYKAHFDNLFSSIGDWFGAMGKGPTNKRFGEDWARLTKDLFFNSKRCLKF